LYHKESKSQKELATPEISKRVLESNTLQETRLINVTLFKSKLHETG